MPENVPSSRDVADRYVETLADLNPLVGTSWGIRPRVDTRPDFWAGGGPFGARHRRRSQDVAQLGSVGLGGLVGELAPAAVTG